VTRERAKELMGLVQGYGVSIPGRTGQSPAWCVGSQPPEHERGITPAEREQIKMVWDSMPLSSCFWDALTRIARRGT
jgi:hypothetical protein